MSKVLLLRKGQSSAGEHMGLARQFILGTQKGTRLKSAITLMGKGLYLATLTPEKPGAFRIVTTSETKTGLLLSLLQKYIHVYEYT